MVGAGGILGYYLDKWLGTTPYLLIVGIFLGAVLGFYYLLRSLHTLHKKDS